MCEIWLGMVQCAKNIIHETPKHERQTKLLELTARARSTTKDVLNGDVDPILMKQAIENDLVKDMAHPDGGVAIDLLPKKRSHKAFSGAVRTLRLKSCHEKQKGKRQQPCGFCGLMTHRIDGCDLRKSMGSLVKDTNIDQLVAELYQRTAPRFLPVHSIPPGHNVFEQMPKDSNYICIHGYASPDLGGADLSQGDGRDDANYLCLTIIFPLNVRTEACTRCFVRTSQVVKWINKSKANSKSVIIN